MGTLSISARLAELIECIRMEIEEFRIKTTRATSDLKFSDYIFGCVLLLLLHFAGAPVNVGD